MTQSLFLLYSVLVNCSDNGPAEALKRLLDYEQRMSMAPAVGGEIAGRLAGGRLLVKRVVE